tara:strand:- start:62 stop:580 length:519 start_codon:yes stop_codon:yes gene_type:complete
MVPDLYSSWHAGISFWKKDKSLNSKSIGIEISNPGHQYGYSHYSKKQIKSLIQLIKKLKIKYKIKKENILGHSDISPLRKKDPGEKFPWEILSKYNLSLWHKLNKKNCKKYRNIKIIENNLFLRLLSKLGYKLTKKNEERKKVIKSFQRRFRPNLINGIIDKECYEILKTLI